MNSVSVWQRKGGERLRSWGIVTLICGSIKLLTRMNGAWMKHESLEKCLNSEIDIFCLVKDNKKIEFRHVQDTPFTWESNSQGGQGNYNVHSSSVTRVQQCVTLQSAV